MTVEIDDLPPIPERRFRHDKGYSAAMRKMQVGQSVLLDTSRASALKLARDVLGRGHYTSREEVDGIRVWRVS